MPEAFGPWWCWAEQVGNDSGGTDTLRRSCGDTEGGSPPPPGARMQGVRNLWEPWRREHWVES